MAEINKTIIIIITLWLINIKRLCLLYNTEVTSAILVGYYNGLEHRYTVTHIFEFSMGIG